MLSSPTCAARRSQGRFTTRSENDLLKRQLDKTAEENRRLRHENEMFAQQIMDLQMLPLEDQ